jgi:4-amino-4-deoxy-L-arabinose transferase-like glycosyltransferase
LDTFNFRFYWHDTAQPVAELVTNPPGLGYLLAPLIVLFGESERILHGLFLAFPLLAVQSVYDIARRFSPHPFRVAILVAAAPMFTVSATTLMADVPALACMLSWLALLLAPSRATGRDPRGTHGAMVLIKYTTWSSCRSRAGGDPVAQRPLRHLTALVLPLAVLSPGRLRLPSREERASCIR